MSHLGGSKEFEIYQIMANKDSDEGFKAAIAKINEHCETQLNTNYIRLQQRQSRGMVKVSVVRTRLAT